MLMGEVNKFPFDMHDLPFSCSRITTKTGDQQNDKNPVKSIFICISRHIFILIASLEAVEYI